MPIPTNVSIYLAGIGDITDPGNREFHLSVQAELHALSVAADLKRTILPQAEGPVDWDLPQAVRPAGVKFGLPTYNLLGYSRAVQLTDDQRLALEAAGILNHEAVVNIAHLPINQTILQFIAGQLSNSKCKAFSSTWSETLTGSVAQVLYITRLQGDVEFDRIRPISAKAGITNGYCQTNVHIACSGANFRYRTKRRIGHEEDMLCYTPAANQELELDVDELSNNHSKSDIYRSDSESNESVDKRQEELKIGSHEELVGDIQEIREYNTQILQVLP
ncbi:hypothetical protein WA026_015145 [Henosepilachna vigintioctopunctata]|uniref:Uncharacterized protein n=1 Tax=Henosepilachna vigintioctopunctata TaxID=420089 RepID=A0AAW1TUT7_9CUCU